MIQVSKIYLGQHDPESYSRKEREDIERATWLLKCRSITIDNGDGRRYSGPGFIRQESSELISWALFDTEASVHLGHALEALGTPGEWLPDTLFYTLAAEDWTGRVWTAS